MVQHSFTKYITGMCEYAYMDRLSQLNCTLCIENCGGCGF